jgi:hypothetical protein
MTPDSRLIVGMVLWRPQPMMLTNSRRSITKTLRRQTEIRQYYASPK